MHNFTSEDLIQYLYNETSSKTTAEIKEALEKDYSLREKLEVITSAQKRLEALTLSPRKKTIENILNYAEKGITEFSA
jgi:beta-galactosidase GanA